MDFDNLSWEECFFKIPNIHVNTAPWGPSISSSNAALQGFCFWKLFARKHHDGLLFE